MIPFHESLRYDIPGLNPLSTVIDVGAYEGNWGRLISERYSCRVYFYEPVPAFFAKMAFSLLNHPNRADMELRNLGVGAQTGQSVFSVKGDMSGPFADGTEQVTVNLIALRDVIGKEQIGCMKLNCEGSEFEILEALLDQGLAPRVEVLHVQSHPIVPDCQARWDRIKARLAETHELMWDEPWCWTGWKRKGLA